MAAGGMDVGALISNQMMAAAKVMEEQIDQEMEKLEKLDEDDLEMLKVRTKSTSFPTTFVQHRLLTQMLLNCTMIRRIRITLIGTLLL